MKPKVRTMLEELLNVFTDKFADPLVSWDRFIEFLATEARGSVFYQLDHKFEWFHEDRPFIEKILKLHDPALLRSDYHDHLGELYSAFWANTLRRDPKDLSFIPYDVAEDTANAFVGRTDERKRIFVPHTGTGRLIMAVHRRAPNSILFGSESDLRKYRIAYTNLCIHRIYASIIHADHDSHELDISLSAGRENWQYANKWYPQTEKLAPKGVSHHAQ